MKIFVIDFCGYEHNNQILLVHPSKTAEEFKSDVDEVMLNLFEKKVIPQIKRDIKRGKTYPAQYHVDCLDYALILSQEILDELQSRGYKIIEPEATYYISEDEYLVEHKGEHGYELGGASQEVCRQIAKKYHDLLTRWVKKTEITYFDHD